MLIVNCLTLLLLSCTHGDQAVPELVWLEDLNNDYHVRHLEMGLPNYLEFNLKRQDGNKLKLRLEENTRLNANAPVYEAVVENGKQKARKLDVPYITNAKFYHDKGTGTAVKIQCKKQPYGACQRALEGSLNMDGNSYEIKPSPTMLKAREMGIQTDVPHLIVRIEPPTEPQSEDRIQGLYGADFKFVTDRLNGEEFHHDHKIIEDLVPAKPNISGELTDDNMAFPESIPKPNIQQDLIDELRSFLGKQLYDDRVEGSQTADKRNIASNEPLFKPQAEEGVAGLFRVLSRRTMEDYSRIEASEHDHVFIPEEYPEEPNVTWTWGQYQEPIPEGLSKPNVQQEIVDELRTLLSEEDSDDKATEMFVERGRQKRAEGALFAIEVVIVIDPALWKKYYALTEANNEMSKETATEYFLRERLSNVINGVSLRYESIEDTDMNVYVTISEFLFYKESNLFSQSINVQVVNGVEYADCDKYIDGLPAWASTAPITNHNDHIMVITGYELYYDGKTENDGVAGIAFVSGACGYYRTSVQEDGSYFVLTSVAAHELGHNLGASHDGQDSSAACSMNDKYIMAPFVASFSSGEKYSINPWRFSDCSIQAFKKFFGSGRCFLDHGDYYNKDEWEEHNRLQPGERFPPDEQCKLIKGENSYWCSSLTSDICRYMACYERGDGYCYYYAAARGTTCGESMWCIDGQCVKKSVTEQPRTTLTTEQTTTPAPSSSSQCVDIGWYDWSCQRVSDYFYETYYYEPSEWCKDPYWANACCEFCRDPVTTTTTMATTTGESCVDRGYYSWTCRRISRYFWIQYGYRPKEWCTDPTWKYNCCAFCTARGY